MILEKEILREGARGKGNLVIETENGRKCMRQFVMIVARSARFLLSQLARSLSIVANASQVIEKARALIDPKEEIMKDPDSKTKECLMRHAINVGKDFNFPLGQPEINRFTVTNVSAGVVVL